MNAAFYEDEEQKKGDGDIPFSLAVRRLLPLIAVHKKRLAICLGLLAAATAASLAWPALIKNAIDGPIQQQLLLPAAQRSFRGVFVLGAGVLAFQLLAVVLQYIQRVMLEIIGQDIMLGLREKLFAHVLTLDLDYFDRNPVGRLMSRIESDTEALRLLFTNTVVIVIGDILLILGIWAIMFATEPRLAIGVLALVPGIVLLFWGMHKFTSPRFLEVRKKSADLAAALTELIHGMPVIQIFHRGRWARNAVNEANRSKFSDQMVAEVSITLFFNFLFLGEYLKVGLVLLLGALLDISPGVIVMFILLVWKEFDPIARTAEQLSSFQKGISGARRIFALLEKKPKLTDPAEPVPWPGLRDAIRFENVWFSYGDDENWVLRDVSFEVAAGSRAALAGMTGGGKTTIISLLLRMYEPQRGRITVDGVDIRDLSRADLRRRFGLVLQDIILFPGDVASNIAVESDSLERSRIESAAETVDAHRFINELPDRYETEVSEKGANFSRGERQLLSFARALAADPDVLVLDEATGSVDPETERSVQRSLGKLMKGRTSIVIAHRLATIVGADQILALRHGEVVERGSHKELLAQRGYYAKLFALQFDAPSDGKEAAAHAG